MNTTIGQTLSKINNKKNYKTDHDVSGREVIVEGGGGDLIVNQGVCLHL